MTDNDLDYLRRSGGWEIGTGPSVVIVDEGMARSFTTTTLRKGVYAFAFGQRGLMAGLGLQGTKITPIHTDLGFMKTKQIIKRTGEFAKPFRVSRWIDFRINDVDACDTLD